jgi:hypothetical protein
MKVETSAIPLILVLICSDTSFKKIDSVLEGITVVVIGVGPVAKETTMDPILLDPSVTEIKNPFSNF